MRPASIKVVSWFRDDPLPLIIDDGVLVVGGTSLLREFVSFAGEPSGRRSLAIAVPFLGSGVLSALSGWSAMDPQNVDFRLVLRRRADAEVAIEQFSSLPWRSLQIGFAPRLHSKMYALVNEGGAGAALIGSHNLSRQGLDENYEAGVLMIDRGGGALRTTVSDIHHQICRLLRKTRLLLDTTRWPALSLSERN